MNLENIDRCRRFNNIDLVKMIMALAVIAVHTHPFEGCNNRQFMEIYYLFVRLAVPFFFLASGYLMAVKMEFPFHKEKDTERVKNSMLKILKLYLTWTAIYSPLAVFYFVKKGTGFKEAVVEYLQGFFCVGEQYNSWPLWYLLSTIYALGFIWLLLKAKVTPEGLLVIAFAVSMISVGMDALVQTTGEIPFGLDEMRYLIQCSIEKGRILRGAVYIPIGMYLAHRRIPLPVNWLMFLGGYIINYYTENDSVSAYMIIITSIGLFGIIERIRMKDHEAYAYMRRISTIIYFIHMYVWTFYYLVCFEQKSYGLDCFLFTAIMSIGIAVGYIRWNSWHKKQKVYVSGAA